MKLKYLVIPCLALVAIVSLLFVNPISQDQNYHQFADQRRILRIPNFLNVLTNLPFAIVGLFGLYIKGWGNQKELKLIAITLFAAFLLLTLGSGYYHLFPANETLVYDRIPITIILMSFFAFIIYDRIDQRIGNKAFIILNVIGIISVIYWVMTENKGKGDLRWYGLVQFFPILAIPVIMVLYKSSFNHPKEVIPIFLFFGLAKVCEKFDEEIYNFLNNIISGHSLKHLFMFAAGFQIVLLIRRRLNVSLTRLRQL